MSGSIGNGEGGVNAAIPLSAGRIGQGGGGNTLASDPSKMVEMMGGMARLQLLQNQNKLFPGQQQLQQQEIQRGGIANEQAQQQLTAYKNKQVAAGMMPLFLKGDSATLSDATSALGWLQAFGSDTTGMTAALKTSGATGGKPMLDVVRAGIIQAYPDLGIPKIEYQQVGDATVPVNTNIYAGPLGPMGPSLTIGATPAEKNQLVPVVDQGTGGVTNVPRISAAPMVGVRGAPGGAAGSAPASGPQMSPMPSPQAGASSPLSVHAPAPLGSPGPLGPAQETALAATGGTSAKTFADISTAGDNARSQDALLSTMQAEAQNFRPGPGADAAMTFKRAILGAGAQFGVSFGIDPKELAAQESVDKIANQLADAQGAGSDARLHVNQGANPSTHNTPAGLDLIIRQLRGNTDYLKARQQLAADYPNKADSQTFLAKVAGNLDPRVFQYNRLTLPQAKDYIKGISDPDVFMKAHNWADSHKLIPSGVGGG